MTASPPEEVTGAMNRYPLRGSVDEVWLFGGISRGLPEMIDGLVQAAIEVDEGIRRPQPAPQFIPCDELARLLEQRRQELDGLIAKRRPTALVRQFPGTSIDGECSEMIDTNSRRHQCRSSSRWILPRRQARGNQPSLRGSSTER